MTATDSAVAEPITSNSRSLWDAVPLVLSPELLALRMDVLEHSEKRMPHWKLRVAADLVINMQPRPGQRTLFTGQAVHGDAVDARAFAERSVRVLPEPHLTLGFDVKSAADIGSVFRATGIHWSRGVPKDEARATARATRPRLVAAIEGLGESATLPLLSNNCLICGKGLSDPVSQARRIGSECWGKLSPASRARAGVTTIENTLF